MASDGTLARYELLEVLSRGGFGAVHRARHKVTKRVVAIKVLHDQARAHGQDGADLVREARALAEIDHPNVVQVLDCGVEDGGVFVVMELMTGQTLAAMLDERGSLPAAEAVPLVMQALDGLHAVHERGIVHRDVKPSNLMVDRRGTVKLVDFGLSIAAEGAASWEAGRPRLAGAGTPGYMAPEQYDPDATLDARADVYAAAATLYRLLSGRLPFVGSPEEVRRAAVLTAAPPIVSLVPRIAPHVAAAIDRALARDRDGRPPTALAFLAALRGDGRSTEVSTLPALSADTPAAHTGEGAPEIPRGSAPPRRALARAGYVAGATAIVGLLALATVAARQAPARQGPPADPHGAAAPAPSAGPPNTTSSAPGPPTAAPQVTVNEPADAGKTTPAAGASATKGSTPAKRPRVLFLAGHNLPPFGADHRGARASFERVLPSIRACAPLACLHVDKVVQNEAWTSVDVRYVADGSGQASFAGVSGHAPPGAACPAFDACVASAARTATFPPAPKAGPFSFELRVNEVSAQ